MDCIYIVLLSTVLYNSPFIHRFNTHTHTHTHAHTQTKGGEVAMQGAGQEQFGVQSFAQRQFDM